MLNLIVAFMLVILGALNVAAYKKNQSNFSLIIGICCISYGMVTVHEYLYVA